MACDGCAIFKTFEVMLCVACLIYKWWTDEEASRIFFFRERISQEWPYQNNVTWNQAGSWFADFTFGGYVLITLGLLVAHIIGELRSTRKTESLLLGIGALLFFGAGVMILTSFDNVPDGLIDNAIILGLLALFTGLMFLVDVGCMKRRDYSDKTNRQDKEFRMERDTPQTKIMVKKQQNGVKKESVNGDVVQEKVQEKVISELRSSIKKVDTRASAPEIEYNIQNEKLQTKERGRRGSENRGFKQRPIEIDSDDELDNGYEYEEHRRRIKRKVDSNSDSDFQYDRKSRGSQTSRSYILEEKSSKIAEKRDAGTSPEDYIQSPKISTTDPHKSDSPISDDYELHPPPSSGTMPRKYHPTLTTSRIQRLSQTALKLNKEYESESTPSSPQDRGYVLHTASNWPNTQPAAPQSFHQWKEKNKILRPVQSAV